MIQEFASYLGAEKENVFTGVVMEQNLFIAISCEGGMTPEEGREFLRVCREKILNLGVGSLSQLDDVVSSTIRDSSLPSGFSWSSGYVKNNVLYLKTIGAGKILIKRNNKVATLVKGDTSASGYFEKDDVFTFTSDKFIELVGGEGMVGDLFDHRSPHQIVDQITPELKAKNDVGAVSIFLKFVADMAVDAGPASQSETIVKPKNFIQTGRDGLRNYYQRFGKRRILTFAVVALIALIFLWSVVLGYQRRSGAKATQEIALAREFIVQKLSEAEEVSFLNMESAIAAVDESRGKLNEVRKLYPTRREIKEIETIIAEAENKILKKEEVTSEEFFDLALDQPKAKGDLMYLDGDNAVILDRTNGSLYTLSLTKKSLLKTDLSDLKKAKLIASYEDTKYFYIPGQGIYTLDQNDKPKKVVDNDKEWGEIEEIIAFNANLYLLDRGKDQIYKYVGAEEAFGAKSSYFAEGQATNLSFVTSMAIDASVYLGGSDTIIKFTSGLRDGFKTNLPGESINLSKVFTTQDLDAVYGWDRDHGMIYVMEKTGEFTKQIKSEILTRAQDVVVYSDEIYVLVGGKVYKIQ